MEQQDHLFELIKTLSKSEKGYFKKVNSFHVKGEQNSYMLLFNTIDKMEAYDEQSLRKQLQGRIDAQLPFLKHYLYYQLLDALDQYYQSSNVEINKWICKTEILFKKGLNDQAEKLLDKAMGFALKKEKFPYLLQLINLKYELLSEEENKEEIRLEKDRLRCELVELRSKIGNLFEYHQLRLELNLLRAETGYARNKEQVSKYELMLDHPALADEKAPLSVSAQYLFYSIRAIIENYTHRYAEAYGSLKKAEGLFHKHPALFEESISARIKTMQRKAAIACTLGKFDEALEDIAMMRALKTGHEKYRALIFQNGYHQETLIYLLTGKFSELIHKVPAFEEEYKRHTGKISKTFELQLLQRIGQAYFIEGKYEDALEWVNKALNTTPSAFRDDVVSGIKVDEIFTHLELGNYRLVKSKIAAAEKYLRSKDKPFKFELCLLSFLEKYIDVPDEKGRVKFLKESHHEIDGMFNNTSESIPVKYFYVNAWVESKIKKRPLAEVLQKHEKHYKFKEQLTFKK